MSSRSSVRFPSSAGPSADTDHGLVGREVTLICVARGGPLLVRGSVAREEGPVLHLAMTDDVEVPVDRGVLEVDGGEDAPLRYVVAVRAAGPRAIVARLVDAPPVDRREYPRLRGTIRLRYRPAVDPTDRAAWLRGDAGGTPLRVPAPAMEFSATGLAFLDTLAVVPGAELLLELGLPGEQRTWRCVGTVIRVSPQADRAAEIAVRLDAMPRHGTIALARYTLRVQEGALGELLADEPYAEL